MLMSLKGQLLETNGRWSVKSTERTVAYVFPALLGILLFLCIAPGALAQGLSGSNLRGVVKDTSGGLVPNASVKLLSTRSGSEREVKTNGEGAYTFTAVEPGPYTLRLKFPAGYKLAPHVHPDSREVTILSGTWYTGYGAKFDENALKALPAGSFYTEPANVAHFVEVREPVVIQVSGMGPSGRKFVDPADSSK